LSFSHVTWWEWKAMETETSSQWIHSKTKNQTNLRKIIKRHTQLCCKIKCLVLTTHTYCMKSITVTRILLRVTSILKCKDRQITKRQAPAQPNLPVQMDLGTRNVHLLIKLNTQCLSLIILQEVRQTETTLASIPNLQ
jgi:hypothetical protein